MITIRQFEDLATNDQKSLLIALELLLQMARMIQSEKITDLVLVCQSSHDGVLPWKNFVNMCTLV